MAVAAAELSPEPAGYYNMAVTLFLGGALNTPLAAEPPTLCHGRIQPSLQVTSPKGT